MVAEFRGGTPHVRRLSVATTGLGDLGFTLPGVTKGLVVSNEGAFALRMYFTLADYTADANYIELAATTGYYDQPDEVHTLWFRAVGGTTTPVVIRATIRRG